MKIKTEAINFMGEAIASGEVFADIKKAVSNIDNSGLPNAEKHSTVFEYIKAIGYPIGKLALNFAIKLAVMWLKAKAK
jgi:hypothetical protein